MIRSIVASLILAAALASTSGARAAEDMTSRLANCRKVADIAARVACYDRFADEQAAARGTSQAPAVRAGSEPPKAQPPAPAPVAQEPAKRFGDDQLKGQAPDAPEQVDEVAAKVAAVTLNGYGIATVTLDNGQVWRQKEMASMGLRVGDAVTLKRGLVGGYFIVPERTLRAFRVTRVQ